MHKSEKGDNKANKYSILSKLISHLHLGQNLCAKYHVTSSSGSPDILLTIFHWFTIYKSKKGHNSVKY